MKISTLLIVALFFVACAKPVPETPVAQATDPLHSIKQTVRTKFPTVPQLATNELDAWLKNTNRAQPLLLDARSKAEYATSHLRGASLASEATETLKSYPKDKPIVAYCAVGYRSSALAEKLKQQGFTNVVNLEGSIFQWANEGHPVYKGEQQVSQVHPFDAKWGELLKPELRAPLP